MSSRPRGGLPKWILGFVITPHHTNSLLRCKQPFTPLVPYTQKQNHANDRPHQKQQQQQQQFNPLAEQVSFHQNIARVRVKREHHSRALSLSLTPRSVRDVLFFFGLMFHNNNNKTQLETGMAFDGGGGAARRRCANLDKNVNERRQG